MKLPNSLFCFSFFIFEVCTGFFFYHQKQHQTSINEYNRAQYHGSAHKKGASSYIIPVITHFMLLH